MTRSNTNSALNYPRRLPSPGLTATSPRTPSTNSPRNVRGYVNAKIGQLKKRMGDLGMLNLANIPKDRSGYGSRIVVIDLQRNQEVEYKLVSSEEADVEKGLISTTSPIGRALLNRRVGDEVQVATPAGKKEFEIVRLATIHDEA